MSQTSNKLLALFTDSHLLGVHYKNTYLDYTYKPLVEGLTISTTEGGEDFVSVDLTLRPSSKTQENIIKSRLPELALAGFLTELEYEKVSPVTVLGTLMEDSSVEAEHFFRNPRIRVAMSLGNFKVTTRTIAGATVQLVTIQEDVHDESATLTFLFGEEDNLHGLSTYINKEFTRSDLRKFLELLNSKVLNVVPQVARLTTPEVNSSMVLQCSAIDEYPSMVIEDGAFVFSNVYAEGVLNYRDKSSKVMLHEHEGMYELRFTSRASGDAKFSVYLR